MVSCCSAVLVSACLAWAAYMGRSCQAAWQGRWLHLVVKLLGGRVHIVSWVVKMTGGIEQAVASCSDCKGLGSNCGAFVSLGGSQRLKRHSSKRQLRRGHYASEAQATPRVDVGDPPEASSFHLCAELSKSNDHLSSRVASRVVLCCQLGLVYVEWFVCHVCLSNCKFSKVFAVCAILAWAGIVLACGGEQGYSTGRAFR